MIRPNIVGLLLAAILGLAILGLAAHAALDARACEKRALSLLQDCLNAKPLYLQDDSGKTVAFILCEVSKEQPA